MNLKWIVIGIVIIIVILGGGYLLLKSNNKQMSLESKAQPTVQTQAQVTSTPTGTTSAKEKIVEITLTSQGFSPSTITIDKGTKVIWTNKSGQEATVNSDPHPFHTDYPPLNLGNFKDGEKLELTLNDSGNHKYHNHFNSSEKGTIIVR